MGIGSQGNSSISLMLTPDSYALKTFPAQEFWSRPLCGLCVGQSSTSVPETVLENTLEPRVWGEHLCALLRERARRVLQSCQISNVSKCINSQAASRTKGAWNPNTILTWITHLFHLTHSELGKQSKCFYHTPSSPSASGRQNSTGEQANGAGGGFYSESALLGLKPKVSRIAQALGLCMGAEHSPHSGRPGRHPALRKKG